VADSNSRKRTLSMTNDLLELEDLSLSDDIVSRRRLLDIRCVKRKFSNRKVVFRENGFSVEDYLTVGKKRP
jgi:hypothetical protein